MGELGLQLLVGEGCAFQLDSSGHCSSWAPWISMRSFASCRALCELPNECFRARFGRGGREICRPECTMVGARVCRDLAAVSGGPRGMPREDPGFRGVGRKKINRGIYCIENRANPWGFAWETARSNDAQLEHASQLLRYALPCIRYLTCHLEYFFFLQSHILMPNQ